MKFPDHMNVYKVGGYVRDFYLGTESKDVDFAVDGCDSLATLAITLTQLGFDIFTIYEDKYTVRCRFPKDDDTYPRLDADFVMCRRDGPYSDGRHPDWVEPGDIYDDLARRDFTVNAMAVREGFEMDDRDGLLDPHGGYHDTKAGVLKFVGDPVKRIQEDALRVVRGLRFMVTKGFVADGNTWAHMLSLDTAQLLTDNITDNRKRDEVHLMFKFNSLTSLQLLNSLPDHTYAAIMCDGKLWLEPTLKEQ